MEKSSLNDKFKLVLPPDLLKSRDFNLSFDKGEASGSRYFDKEASKSRDFDKEGREDSDLNFYEGREDSSLSLDKESEDFINDSYDDYDESDANKRRINYNYGSSSKRRRLQIPSPTSPLPISPPKSYSSLSPSPIRRVCLECSLYFSTKTFDMMASHSGSKNGINSRLSSDADEICPICKNNRYLTPNMKLLVSDCYHKMCESCIDRLFANGAGPCPICQRILRKVSFIEPTFEDLRVEKEVKIRRNLSKQ
ncbi:532_t:CDS:2 [Funneliformis mosseae]|uniref:RNA polymerase II transcription factor B subunit 3 n=1 Tax=Funneliformis mosseae TaxID=27381 RepID=A0A9N8V4S5_FUNMO|nr:532_t:CDS:2 [Funneliformis mosseae]